MDLIGHTHLWETLIRRHRNHRLAHAMVFVGPENVGKTTIAQKLAATILCRLNNECAQCDRCEALARGHHPDLCVIEEAERSIGIDAIRSCRRFASGAPLMDKAKVILIPHADRMTNEAANALLKTLEDPAPGLVMLLTAEQASALPTTIRSRVEMLPCRRVPDATIRAGLRERGIDTEIAESVLPISDGRPGRALTRASDEQARATDAAIHERWATFIERPNASFLSFTAAHDDRETIIPSLAYGQSLLRKNLQRILAEEHERPSHAVAWYRSALRAIHRAQTQLATTNATPKLIFETALLEFLA